MESSPTNQPGLRSIGQNLLAIQRAYPPQSSEEERAMVAEYIADRPRLNELLVLHNIGFATSYVKNYHDRTEDMEDFFMRGVNGLSEAAQHFDPSRGVRFCTFAGQYIQNAVRDLFDPNLSGPKTQLATSAVFDMPVDAAKGDEDGRESIGDYLATTKVAPDWHPVDAAHDCQSRADMDDHNALVKYLVDRFAGNCRTRTRRIVTMLLHGASAPTVASVFGISKQRVAELAAKPLRKIREAIVLVRPGNELFDVFARRVDMLSPARPAVETACRVLGVAHEELTVAEEEEIASRVRRMMAEYDRAEVEHRAVTGRSSGSFDGEYASMRRVYECVVAADEPVFVCAAKLGLTRQKTKTLKRRAEAMVRHFQDGLLQRMRSSDAEWGLKESKLKDEFFNVVEYPEMRGGGTLCINYEQLQARFAPVGGRRGLLTTFGKWRGGFYSHYTYLCLSPRPWCSRSREEKRREAVALALFCEDCRAEGRHHG